MQLIKENQKMKKRNKYEIIRDILDVIKNRHNSIKKTPLLRQSGLSPKSFTEYYTSLIGKKFIKEIKDNHGKIFITLTDKGFKYLDKYNVIIGFFEDFGL